MAIVPYFDMVSQMGLHGLLGEFLVQLPYKLAQELYPSYRVVFFTGPNDKVPAP